MTYDLLIKNGRIIDGSGRPAFHGDVAVARGKIVELGRLGGPARRARTPEIFQAASCTTPATRRRGEPSSSGACLGSGGVFSSLYPDG
jgi:hypothetical protein